MKIPLRIVLVLGLATATIVPLPALPITAEFFPAGIVALADREAVRNTYGALTGILQQVPVNAVPVASFAVPPGGGGLTLFGTTFPSLGNLGLMSIAPRASPIPTVAPPHPGFYFALSDIPRQTNVVIGAIQVPDLGVTAWLFSASLFVLFLFGRMRSVVASDDDF
jgi:hypothetical protein